MVDNISITELTPQDIQKTIDCCITCFGEDWRPHAEADFPNSFAPHPYKLTCFIAKDGDKVIGISCIPALGIAPNTYGISWVCVHPDYRGHQLGRRLIQACEDYIRNKLQYDSASIMLSCGINPGYYEKIGYKALSILHNGNALMVKQIQK